MTIDTGYISGIYQPLCMMVFTKRYGYRIEPIAGSDLGVPWMVGWRTKISDAQENPWTNSYVVFAAQSVNEKGVTTLQYTMANGQQIVGTLDISRYVREAEYQGANVTVVAKAELVDYVKNTFPDGSYGELWTYNIWKQSTLKASYIYGYLAKASDGLPYHFATAANAQRWIDTTLARDAAARPKQGAARDAKLASMLGYRTRVQKSREKAVQRAYLSATLKNKVLAMIDAELNEIDYRLNRI